MIGAVDVAIRYRNLNSHAKFIPFSSICGHDFSSSYSQRLRIVSRIISSREIYVLDLPLASNHKL